MEENDMRCCIMNYSAFMNLSKNEETFTNTVKGNNCLIIDDIEEVLEREMCIRDSYNPQKDSKQQKSSSITDCWCCTVILNGR